jgi:predicted dehydrogenase
VAVSSGHLERATITARNHHIPGVYTNFEEMLDKEKPDLISIVTPPYLHFPMTMAALSRGIHVLCEKPFALDAAEAQQMKAAADHTAVVAMVDFEFRYVPARAYMVDLIRENFVGEIRMCDFIVHLGIRSEPGDVPFDWWSDATKGGGLLGAFGSHVMDTLLLILGKPKRLIADITTFVGERRGGSVTSDDAFSVLIEFQSGARATVQMTTVAGVDDTHFGVYGNLGQLVNPDILGTELRGGKRTDKATSPMEIPQRYLLRPEEGHPLRQPFRCLLNHMIDAIDHNSPSPSPNFEDALKSQMMLDAARSSVKSGGWVSFGTAAQTSE